MIGYAVIIRGAVALSALVLGLAACSASDDTTAPAQETVGDQTTASPTPRTDPTTTTSLEPTSATPEVVLSYFENYNTYSSDDGIAVPGSYADLYGFYLTEINSFFGGPPDEDVVATGEDITITSRYLDGTVDTVTFSDFEFSDEGQLSTFSVDGEPLRARMSLLTEPATNELGVTVDTALVYRTVSGPRYALLVVNNGSGEEWISSYIQRFVSATGQQDESTTQLGSTDVLPGATAVAIFGFDASPETEGQLHIKAFAGDDEANLVLTFG